VSREELEAKATLVNEQMNALRSIIDRAMGGATAAGP